MALIQDAMSASMPATAKQFLGSVQPKPMMQMVMYVAIIGILPLIGYLIGGLIGWGGLTWGLIFGIIMYIGMIASVIGSGMVVGMLSPSILGRQVSTDEAVTVVGYAATPVMLVGFLAGILSGFWALGIVGSILSFLAWIYMAYLLYMAGGVRYGQDKGIIFAIVAVAAGWLIGLIFGMIAWSIAWSMLWGAALGPYGNVYGGGNPYAGLGRYY